MSVNEIHNAKRPLSWSAISSFEYDPQQWYDRYVLKKEQMPTNEMLFGSDIGQRLAQEPKFLPKVVRYPEFEFELRSVFNKIPLIGFIDSFDGTNGAFRLREYKTGRKPWDQKRADEHGQIDMYLLLLYLMFKVRPEEVECHIDWLPTEQTGDFAVRLLSAVPHTFHTKRTMKDILLFGSRIKRVYGEMDAYLLSTVARI